LTIGSISTYEKGVYNAFLQEARDLIKERYGAEAKDYLADNDPERLSEWGNYHNRAVMLATLLKVETKEDADAEWQATELPPEWRGIETFAKSIPIDLANQWVVEAINLNPGQFLALPGDDEKKASRSAAADCRVSPGNSGRRKRSRNRR
jgi:hypothetical protein